MNFPCQQHPLIDATAAECGYHRSGWDLTATMTTQSKRVAADEPFGRTTPQSSSAPLPPRWQTIADSFIVAMQPVVATRSGVIQAYEALLRGFEGHGFDTPPTLLDAAFLDGVLPEIEAAAWRAATRRFATLAEAERLLLFLNIDGRSLYHPERIIAGLQEALQLSGVPGASVVLEVSERQPVHAEPAALAGLKALRPLVGRIALDDYGMGWSGLPLVHAIRPDYIKIDQFFVHGASGDGQKRLFLSHIVNLAHLLGVQVVAEGIETARDYQFCREAGCDYVQGWFIREPFVGPELPLREDALASFIAPERRMDHPSDHPLVQAETDASLLPLSVRASLPEVFERFRREQSTTFFPVVDEHNAPLGIIREQTLKAYAYSPFGKELLANKAYGRRLSSFLSSCPIADVNTPVEKILEMFSAEADSEGILMVEAGRYVGFLSARSLLRILNEKNLATARDQNPLTRLPGNRVINEYLSLLMAESDQSSVVAYIDFDNFKPFNDSFGFRQGDRAITLFATILGRDLPREGTFIGHIGGDDFFAGFRGMPTETALAHIRHLIDRFRDDVESFYDEADRKNGWTLGRDREGVERRIPLLSASAAVVKIEGDHGAYGPDDLSGLIAELKKKAKAAPDRMAIADLGTAS